MNRLEKKAWDAWAFPHGLEARGFIAERSSALLRPASEWRFDVSEKRRQAAAVQEAGAICFVPRSSTSVFARKLPPSLASYGGTSRRDKQVVGISPENTQILVEEVDFSPVTNKKAAWARLAMQVVDFKRLENKIEMSLQAVDFSGVTTIFRDFPTHFSPVRGLIYLRLRRKRVEFFTEANEGNEGGALIWKRMRVCAESRCANARCHGLGRAVMVGS